MKPSKSKGMMITVQGTSLLKAAAGFLLFLFMIFSISGALTSLKPEYRLTSSSVNTAATNVTGQMLYQFLGWENHYFLQGMEEPSKNPSLTNMMFKLSTNINLDDPRSLLGRELPSFSIYDSEILVAGEGTNYTNMPVESSPPLEVLKAEQEAALQNMEGLETDESKDQSGEPPSTTGDKEVVYVYFTHNTESYLPYLEGVTDPNAAYHSKVNVTKIGDKLEEELESRGIGTTIDKTDVQALLNKKNLGYGNSYQESREVVQAAVTADKNLTYLIDIHRDASRKKDTTKVINGESYAKLAFIIGGNNQNHEKNYKFAKELHDRLEEKYKGISRGIIQKQGASTNGKFNQDLSENAILIEFGGVDNTFDELNRSAEALAEVFSEFYWQAEEVNQPANDTAEKK